MDIKNISINRGDSKRALVAVLFVIGTIAVYNQIVAPQAKYLFAAGQFDTVTNKLKSNQTIVASDIKVKEKQIVELREKLTNFYGQFFTRETGKGFLDNIQTFSDESNCFLVSLRVISGANLDAKSGGAEHKTTISMVELSVVGNFMDILNFVEKVQDRPERVNVCNLTLKTMKEGSSSLKADMAIMIYVKIDDGEISHEEDK